MKKGDFHMRIQLGRTTYVMNRTAASAFLKEADALGDDCSDGFKRMRDDLRMALRVVPDNGEDAEIEATHQIAIDLSETESEAEPERDPDAPLCAMCGQRGEALPLGDGETETLWVCTTPGCLRRGRPTVRAFFEAAQRKDG